MMHRWRKCGCLAFALMALNGCFDAPAPVAANAAIAMLNADVDGPFRKADQPRTFDFPADHGSHPDFRTEWWYFSGHLDSTDDPTRSFGFQFTIFRFGIGDPRAAGAVDESSWATAQLWQAHFAISDLQAGRFVSGHRTARDAFGLAGAEPDGARVFVEDVVLTGLDGDAVSLYVEDKALSMRLQLRSGKPIILQGEQGLSAKSEAVGNASYYYSMPRWEIAGEISLRSESMPDQAVTVKGSGWLDREWSTSALAPDQVGWDWFALQFDDHTELMIYRIRRDDGATDPASRATWIDRTGSATVEPLTGYQLMPTRTWVSDASGVTYPVEWQLKTPRGTFTLRTVLDMQEHVEPFVYWEGAMEVSGDRGGRAYVEMTGYR